MEDGISIQSLLETLRWLSVRQPSYALSYVCVHTHKRSLFPCFVGARLHPLLEKFPNEGILIHVTQRYFANIYSETSLS
jgi:hypothetical protein